MSMKVEKTIQHAHVKKAFSIANTSVGTTAASSFSIFLKKWLYVVYWFLGVLDVCKTAADVGFPQVARSGWRDQGTGREPRSWKWRQWRFGEKDMKNPKTCCGDDRILLFFKDLTYFRFMDCLLKYWG